MRNRSRLHIVRVRHPRQRAGIAMACPLCTRPAASLAHQATASCMPSWRPLCTRPAASLAHRATASCSPIVHPPSCQPGPSGNRQLHAHCAPAQLTAWPIGQPPAARPLCARPADSLAHRATASYMSIVHPPSWQPGPSGNRQLHAHSAPPAASLAHRATASCMPIVHPQLPAWPIGQPPAACPQCTRPAASLAHRATASCMPGSHPAAPWTLAQLLGRPSVHPPAPHSPVPSNLWLISPLSPHITDEDETRMPVFKCLPN